MGAGEAGGAVEVGSAAGGLKVRGSDEVGVDEAGRSGELGIGGAAVGTEVGGSGQVRGAAEAEVEGLKGSLKNVVEMDGSSGTFVDGISMRRGQVEGLTAPEVGGESQIQTKPADGVSVTRLVERQSQE